MPEALTPDRYSLGLEDGVPTADLGDAEIHDAEGWQVLVRTTLLVVDGPGDEGFLLRRTGEDGRDVAPDGWEDAATTSGEVLVRAGGTSVRATVLDD